MIMLGDPSVRLIHASIALMDGFDQRLMRCMVKTLIGSAQLNHCDSVCIGAMAMDIGTLPHISVWWEC
jgi:hypothetical protein